MWSLWLPDNSETDEQQDQVQSENQHQPSATASLHSGVATHLPGYMVPTSHFDVAQTVVLSFRLLTYVNTLYLYVIMSWRTCSSYLSQKDWHEFYETILAFASVSNTVLDNYHVVSICISRESCLFILVLHVVLKHKPKLCRQWLLTSFLHSFCVYI